MESRELYRPVKEEVRERYAVVPDTSLRNGDLELRLETTWMERIESYLSASKAADDGRERVRQVTHD